MLVFISDIHLTDETTGKHNVSKEVFEFFWNDIQIGSEDTKPVELIILGDFIDVIRSTVWNDKTEPRPWNDNNGQQVMTIVNGIITANKPLLDHIKALVNAGRINLHYVIGNHDRLLNKVPQARALICSSLGINGPNDPIPEAYVNQDLSIYATHGHEADVYNDTSNGKSPIGDAVVTLLINTFPDHKDLKNLTQYNKIKTELEEIDNLRPDSLAPLWIDYCVKPYGENTVNMVREAWKNVLEEFNKDKFVRKWFDEYDSWLNPIDKADQLQIAFEHFTESSMRDLLEKIIEIRNDFYKPKEDYLKKAVEYMGKKGCDYVLFGHTHEPSVHLIEESPRGGKFYINTGTWRKRIIMGEPRKKVVPFAPVETISYVQFYDDNEYKKTNRRFEIWDGSKGFGK